MNKGAKETAASVRTDHDAPPGLLALALGSVGVVYGDIGTSPLYAFREAAIAASNNHVVTRGIVLGVLSLIVWALIINSYAEIRVDPAARRQQRRGRYAFADGPCNARSRPYGPPFVFILGVIGASMFLGNSVITPAISVLSAVEGAQARKSGVQ